MIAGLMAISAGVAVAAAPAFATSCDSWLNTDVNSGADAYQAGVSCRSIDSDHKVRAQLDRKSMPDVYSDYFTTENKAYRTDYVYCPFGCTDDYQIEND